MSKYLATVTETSEAGEPQEIVYQNWFYSRYDARTNAIVAARPYSDEYDRGYLYALRDHSQEDFFLRLRWNAHVNVRRLADDEPVPDIVGL